MMEPITTAAVAAPTAAEMGTAFQFLLGLLSPSATAIIVDGGLILIALVVIATGLLPIVQYIVANTETKVDDKWLGKILAFVGNPVTRAIWGVLQKFALDFSKKK